MDEYNLGEIVGGRRDKLSFPSYGLRASSLVFSRRNRGFVTISLVFYISVLFSKTQLIPHPEEKFYW